MRRLIATMFLAAIAAPPSFGASGIPGSPREDHPFFPTHLPPLERRGTETDSSRRGRSHVVEPTTQVTPSASAVASDAPDEGQTKP